MAQRPKEYGPATAFRFSTIAQGPAGPAGVGVAGPTGPAGPAGAGVTWANDLAGSTSTNQYVAAVSGPSGAGGTVPLGDGTHNFFLRALASLQTTTPVTEIVAAAGFALASGVGGALVVWAGAGGTAAAGNVTGGLGGNVTVSGGTGGASTGTAANSNGGNVVLNPGAAGTGGSGAAGASGNVLLLSGGATYAFVTTAAAGTGFGIGTTPGTDPTITRGTGVPATTQPNGSVFLRTDGTSTTGIYTRQSGAWSAVGGAVGTSWANDLVNSTGTNQYVSSLSYDSTGAAGAGGAIAVKGTATVLNWLNNAVTLNYSGFTMLSSGLASGDFLRLGASTATLTVLPTGLSFGATAAPAITQTVPSTDVAPANMTFTAQGAELAAVTNLTGGNIVLVPGAPATTNGSVGNILVSLPAHTGTGQNGYFQVKQGTSAPVIQMGGYGNTANPTAGGIWMNPSHPPTAGYGPTFYNDTTDTLVTRVASMNTLVSGNACMSATNANIQFFSQTNIGTGLNVIGITNVITVPTTAPTTGLLLWSNTGSPGSLGLYATGVQFHKAANASGVVTVSQDPPTTDVLPNQFTVQAQGAWSGASTNVNGASLFLAGGAAATGFTSNGSSIALNGATPTNLGGIAINANKLSISTQAAATTIVGDLIMDQTGGTPSGRLHCFIDGVDQSISATRAYYGDGSDGTATCDGSTAVSGMSRSGSVYTLTRDVFFANLTVNNGVTVRPGGYRIFVQHVLTMGSAITALIDGSGANAAGSAGGAARTTAILSGGSVGGNAGLSGGASPNSAGFSGNGGSGAGTTGGVCGLLLGSFRIAGEAILGASWSGSAWTQLGGGSSGSGGVNGTGVGGGGGAGGAVVVVAARVITGGSAGLGNIRSNGGNGAASVGGTSGGGGGGGGGGCILITSDRSGYTGGVASVHGTAGGGTGSAGAGANGNDGVAVILTG